VIKTFLIFQLAFEVIFFSASEISPNFGFRSQVSPELLSSSGTTLHTSLEDADSPNSPSEKLARYLKHFGRWTPVLFWLASFISAMLFVPVTVAAVLSGLLFGKMSGTLLLTTSVTAAAMTAFLIGRRLDLRSLIQHPKHTRVSLWLDTLENLFKNNGFTAFFILRNLPHPFILISYLAGSIKTAKVGTFGSATFLFLLIRGFAFIYLGESLLKGPRALIFPVVLIFLCILLSFAINRRSAAKQCLSERSDQSKNSANN
jgi:uncharacterized membrane protein YdjX (TVP38/TMEM64 family)